MPHTINTTISKFICICRFYHIISIISRYNNIKSIRIVGKDFEKNLSAVSDGTLTGTIGKFQDGYATYIGTYDGNTVGTTPVGEMSSELIFDVDVPCDGDYAIYVTYATGEEIGCGSWIQIATMDKLFFDDILAK